MISACSDSGWNSVPYGQSAQITEIKVFKSSRKLITYHQNRELRRYDVALGFSPVGHKTEEGDGKTPSGRYHIDRKNPYSKFHLSLGISYPNKWDKAQARKRGVSPGGEIMIHGQPNSRPNVILRNDWTAGCIAVSNPEIEELYSAVKIGTPVSIYE